MKITLKQLRVFDEIVRSGNVTLAAETLSMTQSAASMSLRDLEDRLDGPLFHRRGKRLSLNAYGQWLQPQAHEVLLRVEAIEVSDLEGQLRGHLQLGASSTIANYLLPPAISRFAELHEGVLIDLKVGNSKAVIDDLQALRIDLGLIEGTSDNPALLLTPWQADELVVIAAPHHPLSGRDMVDLEDLSKYAWILRETGSGTREIFSRAVRALIHPLKVQMELGNSEAIKHAVISGNALSCLSKLVVADEVRHGELCILQTPALELHRQLYMVTRAGGYRSQLLQSFLDTIWA